MNKKIKIVELSLGKLAPVSSKKSIGWRPGMCKTFQSANATVIQVVADRS